jgi:Mg2+ and Co2+ transporter CorA
LFLVDSPIKVVLETGKLHNRYDAKPLHGGYEDFNSPPIFSFSLGVEKHLDCNRSMAGGILRHFMAPPVFSPVSPQILSISYYALQVSLSEWLLYTLLISRYCKHYEYSLNDISTRLHDDDIIDLQRWRRRTKQSRQKLEILAHFIEYWGQGVDTQAGNMLLKDIQYIQKQLDDYSRSLEQMLTVATSMVQLLDSRRSILEAVSVRRLTYIALVFVPLSWVSSLFSMSDTYLPGHGRFWVYFAVALPLICLCFLYEVWPMINSRTRRF